MKLAIIAFALLIHPAFAGWSKFQHLVVSDPPGRTMAGVRITYLGTNGYLLESKDTALLIDPYFSRVGLGPVIFNSPIRSSPARVTWGLRKLPKRIDGIVVTHGHFDHLLDVPEVARRTSATLLASQTSVSLAISAGLQRTRTHPMAPGDTQRIGQARVRALAASHDRLFGCCVPFPGRLSKSPIKAPQRPANWVCGEPLAYLIEFGRFRIYVDSGGTTKVVPPRYRTRIDLAIIGTALADSRGRLPQVLAQLRPRFLLPSHQDDFFRPLNRGFAFGALSDFPHVIRTTQSSSTRLILLDYFQPWTLQ